MPPGCTGGSTCRGSYGLQAIHNVVQSLAFLYLLFSEPHSLLAVRVDSINGPLDPRILSTNEKSRERDGPALPARWVALALLMGDTTSDSKPVLTSYTGSLTNPQSTTNLTPVVHCMENGR